MKISKSELQALIKEVIQESPFGTRMARSGEGGVAGGGTSPSPGSPFKVSKFSGAGSPGAQGASGSTYLQRLDLSLDDLATWGLSNKILGQIGGIFLSIVANPENSRQSHDHSREWFRDIAQKVFLGPKKKGFKTNFGRLVRKLAAMAHGADSWEDLEKNNKDVYDTLVRDRNFNYERLRDTAANEAERNQDLRKPSKDVGAILKKIGTQDDMQKLYKRARDAGVINGGDNSRPVEVGQGYDDLVNLGAVLALASIFGNKKDFFKVTHQYLDAQNIVPVDIYDDPFGFNRKDESKMKITKPELQQVIQEEIKKVISEMVRLRPKDIHNKMLTFQLLQPMINKKGKPDVERVSYRGKIVKLPGISRSELRDPLSPEQPVIVELENGDMLHMIPGTDQKLTLADVTYNL